MRIRIDRERCCGSGMCALTAPEVFDQDAYGTVVLLDARPPAEMEKSLHDAEANCPCEVITLVE